ncbi:MAG: DUF3854 domain-containing protein [Nostoc sp. ZfuVER08]|nr:DUF3854 domain-containing protein [Nostoc sp. ZfuVER08]
MINTNPSAQSLVVLDAAYESTNKFNSFEEFKSFVRVSFIEGSSIDSELFESCIEFHQDLEFFDGHDCSTPIHDALNWEYKRFTPQAKEPFYAAFLMNEDGTVWQAILSLWDEEKQRPYRYLAPKGNGDRAFLPPVTPTIRKRIASRYGVEVPMEGSFWEWVKTSPLPRIVTEGGKKSLAGLSLGYILIALYGCRCGAGKSKDETTGKELLPHLTPDLAGFATDNSMWLIGFDRDDKHKAKISVGQGKRRLAKALKLTANCYVEDIVWRTDQGKGLDDLIVLSGNGAFDRAYSEAAARLEKQFFKGSSSSLGEDPDKQTNPPPDQVVKKIAEDYRGKLSFNDETKRWMRYEADCDGMWSPESNEFTESIVYKILVSEGISGFSADYVSGIVKLLRHELIERRWHEASPRDFLPFRNGVAEVSTGKLLPHNPGYKFTWQLPRDYSTQAGNWDSIDAFLEHLADGNADIKEILICYCNAVLKGRYDLQRFLHLIGMGGTGKGTYSRLLIELIGDQNVLVTSMDTWCTNQFEGANAYGKRLVLFPDTDPYRGAIGRFLSLTGEDKVRAERKGETAFNFDYDGMTLVLSNFPVFSGNSSSRAKRRTITVPCNKLVPETKRTNLSKVFEPEISAFTNYLLSIPDDHVTNVLKGVKEIPRCTLEFWENQMKGDALAAWLNDRVIFDPTAETPVGNDKNEGANGQCHTLFGSYARHCLLAGDSAKSYKVFSPDLVEMCQTILGWRVEKHHTNTGKFIKGLRLRVAGQDDNIPTHDCYLMQRVTDSDGLRDGLGDGLSDGLKPLQNKESDGCDGLSDGSIESQENVSIYVSPEPSPPVTDSQPNTISTKKDFNFWLIDPTILTLHIPSPLGEIVCTAKPVVTIVNAAKIPVGYQCSLVWIFPNGQEGTIEDVPLLAAGDFEKTAKKIAKEWLYKQQEPWKPQINHPAMYGGELVTVVGYWERKWQIELPSGRFLYVKASKLSEPSKS